MARELRRLLIDPARLHGTGAVLALSREESHYLGRVLRLRSGGRFAVVDGCGHLWTARLLEEGRAELEQPVEQPLERQEPPAPRLVLALAMPRRDGEVVLRMATELGVDGFRLLRAERGVLRGPEGGEGEVPGRWRTIVREAAEQCERLWLPTWEPSSTALELLRAPDSGSATAGASAVFGVRLLATTRREGLPALEEALAPLEAGVEGCGSITLAIGPEGGWSALEEERAAAAGWRAVSLGATILRSSTAAVAAVARLAAALRPG
ncbi:MAG: 16S rRNA (uracil(1498)-N(3))-methyltransferase [Synechococcus sp.]|nr:16S rRNA (uracil(1498)-N(3))-methyltransferase [Synechococcus sp.]